MIINQPNLALLKAAWLSFVTAMWLY